MRDVHMRETVPTDSFGVLRAGKPYHVSDSLARELVRAKQAVYLPLEPETAAVEPTENAATRTRRPRGRGVASE